jgi:predicted metal-dependent hydrolase
MRAAPPREWRPLEEAVPRDVFQAQVEAWAKRIGVRPRVVQIRPMKRKWGSCSTAGRASLDADLLRQHAEFRKRIIVEELLHFRIPKHGKLFKTTLAVCLKRSV